MCAMNCCSLFYHCDAVCTVQGTADAERAVKVAQLVYVSVLSVNHVLRLTSMLINWLRESCSLKLSCATHCLATSKSALSGNLCLSCIGSDGQKLTQKLLTNSLTIFS